MKQQVRKINHDEFVEQITNSMNNLPQGKIDNRIKAAYKGGEYREEKELEQIHLVLGFEGLNCHDDDYDALRVYSAIMGRGGSSRLFQEIREKRGLVYGIGAGSEFFSDTGTFQVIAGTGKNEIKELLPVLCEELINSPKNLKEQEIEKSKAQLKTSTLMSIESTMANAMTSAYELLHYEKLVDLDEKIEKINKVTKSSIETVANKLFTSTPTISSIGPIKNLETINQIQNRLN